MLCLKRINKSYNNWIKQLTTVSCFIFCAGCIEDFGKDSPEETELARVGVHVLKLSDVLEKIQITPEKDSTAQVKLFINNWVKSHVVLQKAEIELFPEEKKFNKQLEDYRTSLLRYAYEQKYISENLDTTISNQEINTYYQENKNNFELKENIVRVRYVRIDKKKTPLKPKFKKLISATSKNEIDAFVALARKNKIDFYCNDSTWVFFDELLSLIPIEVYNKENFLQTTKYYEFTTTENDFLLYFCDYKIKDNISPLEFEREKIKRILLNQRKVNLIEEMEIKVYEEALKEGDVKIIND